ncbi:MAG: hypothetical protein ACLFTQ_04140 [Candidatus Aenigmatarchaeota archaeon]
MNQEVPCWIKPEAYVKRYEVAAFIENKTSGADDLNDLKVVNRGDANWDEDLVRQLYIDDLDERLVDEMVKHYDDEGLLGKKSEAILVEGINACETINEIKGPITAPGYEGTDTVRGITGLPAEYNREIVIDGEEYTLSLNGFHSP